MAPVTVALALLLTACGTAPTRIVREAYPVEVVREVVRPVPAALTDPLPIPTLPDRPLVWRDLADAWLQCRATLDTANADRLIVDVLTDPTDPNELEGTEQ